MIEKALCLCLVCLALLSGAASYGQTAGEGMIVRFESELVYIDLGQRHGVSRGDLFDVLASEILSDPRTGDTLAVTPRTVGALRIVQVADKLSIGRLLHLEPGEDPMLKEVARVQDPDRLRQIERYVRAWQGGAGGMTEKRLALVPGRYHLEVGEKRKGWSLMALETASLLAGIGYRISSNDYKDKYDKLNPPQPASEYDFYFSEAQNRRDWSNRFFLLAGAIYAYNWVDVLWLRGRVTLSARGPDARPLEVGAGMTQDGTALLQVAHRF